MVELCYATRDYSLLRLKLLKWREVLALKTVICSRYIARYQLLTLIIHETHDRSLRCRSDAILFIKFCNLAHLLYINPIPKHCVSFSGTCLPICEYRAIKSLNYIRYAVLYECEYVILTSVSAIHTIVLSFDDVSHILNTDRLSALSHVTHTLLGHFPFQLGSNADSHSNLFTTYFPSFRYHHVFLIAYTATRGSLLLLLFF
jgi:hypothetical protein